MTDNDLADVTNSKPWLAACRRAAVGKQCRVTYDDGAFARNNRETLINRQQP